MWQPLFQHTVRCLGDASRAILYLSCVIYYNRCFNAIMSEINTLSATLSTQKGCVFFSSAYSLWKNYYWKNYKARRSMTTE